MRTIDRARESGLMIAEIVKSVAEEDAKGLLRYAMTHRDEGC